ncbi:MAG: hypothetical protein RSB70_04395 [Clostridium sp.]
MFNGSTGDLLKAEISSGNVYTTRQMENFIKEGKNGFLVDSMKSIRIDTIPTKLIKIAAKVVKTGPYISFKLDYYTKAIEIIMVKTCPYISFKLCSSCRINMSFGQYLKILIL